MTTLLLSALLLLGLGCETYDAAFQRDLERARAAGRARAELQFACEQRHGPISYCDKSPRYAPLPPADRSIPAAVLFWGLSQSSSDHRR